jgi:hypothetical protein
MFNIAIGLWKEFKIQVRANQVGKWSHCLTWYSTHNFMCLCLRPKLPVVLNFRVMNVYFTLTCQVPCLRPKLLVGTLPTDNLRQLNNWANSQFLSTFLLQNLNLCIVRTKFSSTPLRWEHHQYLHHLHHHQHHHHLHLPLVISWQTWCLRQYIVFPWSIVSLCWCLSSDLFMAIVR